MSKAKTAKTKAKSRARAGAAVDGEPVNFRLATAQLEMAKAEATKLVAHSLRDKWHEFLDALPDQDVIRMNAEADKDLAAESTELTLHKGA